MYIKIILGILAVIFIFSFLVFLMYLRPPKFTTDITPEKFNLEYEKISFQTKDGLTLRGWFVPSNYSNSTIIIGHGFPFDKGNVLPVTKFLNEHYNLLYYDFRYFGESDGEVTTIIHKERDDLLRAIDYLKKRDDVGNIGILGFSLSAANALLVNSEDVKAIVSDSSFMSVEEILKVVYFVFPGFLKYPFVWMTALYAKVFLGVNILGISPMMSVKTLDTPILFIHGEHDSQIPLRHSEILHENALNSELWIVKGADHGMSYAVDPIEYKTRIMNFFDRYLLKK